jgi:HD-like signal output (HDOD) protein
MAAKSRSKARLSLVDQAQFSERTNTLLDRALELGSMPESTRSLLALTRRDNAELGPVVDALALNPNLSAAVLRVANSSAYGQTRSIADLHRAVTVIGMQELHDLVAGTAMMAVFSRPHPLSERLQASAVLSAAIAQKLAVELRVGAPSTAYLSGLMCELGALACIALDPDFPALYESCHGDARLRFNQESARYGGSTAVIGARILAMSMLPALVTEAVATTGFEPVADKQPLGCTIAFARLAADILVRAAEHGDPTVLESELSSLAAAVGLPTISPESLTRACLAAATTAELTLRGELGLAQQQAPANDVAPQTRSQAARDRGSKMRGLYLLAAALATAAAFGVTAWMLRH